MPALPLGEAKTRKKRTKGSARPSLSPDSRLSVWRTAEGTSREATTAEVTTGSVGASTAPSRKASGQLSSGNSTFAARPSNPIVIGIAITSERATGLQWRRSSSRSTNIPSEKRVRTSASSISSTIDWSVASTWTTPVAAKPMPRATESTEAERTVPRISPERAATIASSPPKSSSASPNPMSNAYPRLPSKPRSTSSSAICTALVAAPLRRLSPTTQRLRVRSRPGSRRMRPTST